MPEENVTTITFELIRIIQREEQRIPKLTKLPENFFTNVDSYLQQKRRFAETKDDRKGELESKNIERLIEDIFNRRERKILNQAIISARTNIPPENLTDEEKVFYDDLVISIKARRLSLERMLQEEKKEEVKLVVFKEEVTEFVASDMKTYGPFKKGDIARLPEENIDVLMERGIVEEFKVSK
jgi:DNA replication initiation complex subunit (GINS family)